MLRTKIILSYDICWVRLFHCIHVIFLLLGVLPNTGGLPSDSCWSGGIRMEPGDKTSFSKTATPPCWLSMVSHPDCACSSHSPHPLSLLSSDGFIRGDVKSNYSLQHPPDFHKSLSRFWDQGHFFFILGWEMATVATVIQQIFIVPPQYARHCGKAFRGY